MNEVRLQADFLIIGGGVAGLNAALTAVEKGLKTIITDKSCIEHSGNIAGGVDHFLAYLETGPAWDTRDAYLEFTARANRGAADLAVIERVYCDELQTALQRFTEIGCPLHRPGGGYFRTQSYGQPGPWYINFNGKRLKPLLAKAVRRAGCQVLDRVVITDLLVNGGAVTGAVGFHLREGTFFVIETRAVLIATGGTNRLYQNPTGLSFNTWMCPVNTGDGEAVALRAGGVLANIEYLRMTVVPRGFNAAGLNALVGMGARLVNALGEDFMFRYHPLGMQAPRYCLVQGVLGEIKAHRGPVYVDCRHLEPDALNHLVTTLGYDKDTLPDFFQQKGIDLSKDLLEVGPSDGMQGGPSEVCGSGVKINADCATNVPGLLAAGNSADQCRSLHMAVTSGIHAGRTASDYVRSMLKAPSIPDGKIREMQKEIYAPLHEPARSISWKEFEDVLQRVVTEGLGPVRSGPGLEKTKEKLVDLTKWFSQVKAENYHDLCRVHELRNMLTVAQGMVRAALFRTESRFGQCHYRLDFPATDDDRWLGQVLVKLNENGEITTSFLPLKY
jgi:adenylylsulfate reductase subunit A